MRPLKLHRSRSASACRGDEMPLTRLRPGQDGVRSELRPIVGDNHAGPAAPFDQRRQLARNPLPGDRCVRDRRQAFTRYIVDDVEDAESSATGELVVHEVERPSGIRLRLDEDRRPCSHGAAARRGAPSALPRGRADVRSCPSSPSDEARRTAAGSRSAGAHWRDRAAGAQLGIGRPRDV